MPNELPIRADGVAGGLSVALAAADTTLSSGGLADLPVIDTNTFARVTLAVQDSAGRVTKKEVVHVTAHAAGATSATIVRGREGTAAQAWALNDRWAHDDTAQAIRDEVRRVPVNTYTANQTMTAADLGARNQMNLAGANTYTVAPNSAVPCPVGTLLEVAQIGAGATTIAAATGVTINKHASVSFVLDGPQSTASLIKTAMPDTWHLDGRLVAAA